MNKKERLCSFCLKPAHGKADACKKCLDALEIEGREGSPSVRGARLPLRVKEYLNRLQQDDVNSSVSAILDGCSVSDEIERLLKDDNDVDADN